VGLDFAMADLVVSHFNEFVAAASLGPDLDVDRANDLSPYAPNGVYPTRDGWIAVSVDGDEEFVQLMTALTGEPESDPSWGSRETRFEHRTDIDTRLARLTPAWPAADLAAELRARGVTAEKVATPADLLASDQFTSRGFFVAVDHDEWGTRRLVGIPWRPFGGPPIPLGAPPRLQPLDEDGA
jgi:crotonobetainyl-CoA:carnitine CoA-transferase CaiB-like acyl-CoA transferase